MTQDWQQNQIAKRTKLAEKIPEEWILDLVPSNEAVKNASAWLDEMLPDSENQIVSMTINELISNMESKKISALQVTTAFCRRAAYAHQLVNCCTEIFFEKAFKRAKFLDDYLAENGKLYGPLHGVPISLKDQVNIRGIVTSLGYVGLLDNEATEDATIYSILDKLGAVFYVKTTVPMAIMSGETYSNAYGYTQNSVTRTFSAGGSSGGEASIIGSKASIIGFGTDLGGSIRTPSSYHGIFGLRPSHGRIPYQGVANSMSGQPIMPSVIGPMAQSLDDIELVTKLIVESESWKYDSKVVPLPWNDFKVDKLVFGVMKWDKLVMPHPPILRAIEQTVENLRRAGHEIFEWEPINHAAMRDLAIDIFGADGMKEVLEVCKQSGEPYSPALQMRPDNSHSLTINEHWEQANEKYAFQKTYYDYWNSTANLTQSKHPVDAIIGPARETVGLPPFTKPALSTYTSVANVLDCTALVLPVTRVDKTIDVSNTHTPINDDDIINASRYDPNIYDGHPVCIQMFCRRFEEEKCIAIGKEILRCNKA